METSQQELEQGYTSQQSVLLNNVQGESELNGREADMERKTTANIPVVRGNTPRLSSYSIVAPTPRKYMIEAQREQHDNVTMPPFPSKPPSAPPVPEAETRFDVIEKSRLPEAIQLVQEERVQYEEQTEQARPRALEGQERQSKLIEQAVQKPQEKADYSHSEPNLPLVSLNKSPRSYRLVGFAIYLLCLLLVVLVLGIVQSIGLMGNALAPDVALLGVPWMVLLYGLLGGCVSCLFTLGRSRRSNPPGFVIITWYARPFAAVVLALFAYLLLNGALLIIVNGTARYQSIALVMGGGVGLCEGWFFLRRSERS